MAKSILDNRLIDLPLSPLMWDLIFGKVSIKINALIFVIESKHIQSEKPWTKDIRAPTRLLKNG
jgi:hypothetical protein